MTSPRSIGLVEFGGLVESGRCPRASPDRRGWSVVRSQPEQPNPGTSRRLARAAAVDLFAQFLERVENGEPVEIEPFAREHAPHEDDLRRLYADWRLLELAPARPAGPVRVIDERSDPAAWRRFLKRLRAHAPDDSRYRVGEELSRGAMGRIVSVFDQDLKRHQVMKVMLENGSESTARRGRFLEEAQVTAQLDHPGIVPVHDLGVDRHGQVFFTMKRVTGEDLRHVLARQRSGEPGVSRLWVVGLLLSACEALESAHDRGVIHRDLKPANIMVGAYGETYVMDWGLARVLSSPASESRLSGLANATSGWTVERERQEPVTLDGDVLGTPAYMSPEQARGRLSDLGPHSDVYALGAILYELLAGHAPYTEPGAPAAPHAVLGRVLAGPPPALAERAPEAPAELSAICEKAMAREIPERYRGMAELAGDLRAYLEHRVVSAYESGPVAELRKWIGRHRLLFATAAAAVLFISVLTGWFLVGQKEQEREAERAARVAQAARMEADTREREMGQLSDLRVLDGLRAELDRLWPAVPKRVPAMRDWLLRAERLAARLPAHEQTLASLTRLTRTPAPERESGVERPPWLEEGRLDWWFQTLSKLVSELAAFSGGDPGDSGGDTIASLRARLAFAETVRDYSITYYQDEWNNAIESIADEAECPAYEGLLIREQLGLVPIGRDPRSGLWEFWQLQTGERPQRDLSGELIPTERSGLVFVLIPGGRFWMGAQSSDPAGRNFDPAARQIESDGRGSPTQIHLDPFLLSKYELTQGQWQRATGANPSRLPAGLVVAGHTVTLRHPVERVSWESCMETLRRLDLALPTEAQWEYACRARTESPWWTGDRIESLESAANLAGAGDGFLGHAPAGWFGANPFGLHDLLGNVSEWCQDAAGSYETAPEPKNGERLQADPARRVQRGGSYAHGAERARSANRSTDLAGNGTDTVGLRPARELR